MAREISTNGRKKLSTLMQEFNNNFPYLILVIGKLDENGGFIQCDINNSLSEVRTKKGSGEISFTGSKNVGTIEREFSNIFGLTIQISSIGSDNQIYYSESSSDKISLTQFNQIKENEGCKKGLWNRDNIKKSENSSQKTKEPEKQNKEELLKIKELELVQKEKELELKMAKIDSILALKKQQQIQIEEEYKRKIEESKKIEEKKRKEVLENAEIERRRYQEILNSVLIPYQSKVGEKLWGYVDVKMNWVIKPKYKYVNPFFDCGVAIVGIENPRSILINKFGDELLKNFQGDHTIDYYYIEKSRKEFFNRLKTEHRFYFEFSYNGLIPVKVINEKYSFIDLNTKMVYNSNFDRINVLRGGFFEIKGDKNLLLSLNSKVLVESYHSFYVLGDNCFGIKFKENTNYRYYRFIEKAESLEEFKLDFTLKQGERVSKVFKGYFEVMYNTYIFDDIHDKTFLKYFKDGKQICEFEQYTKQFCIDTSGNYLIKNNGYGDKWEKYFWFDYEFSEILSLKNNKSIYSQGKPKDYKDNYKILSSLYIKNWDHSELIFIDWLTGESKEIKVNKDFEEIYEIDFYFGLRKVYGDYYDYLIDQSGSIVLENYKKKGYYSQIKPTKVPDWFFVIQSGIEYLVNNKGFCHKEGKNIEELFLNKQNSFSAKDIEPLIKLALERKIIEEQVLDKVKTLDYLKYLQINYLNCKNKEEGEHFAARIILSHLGVNIQKIKFAVKIKSEYTTTTYLDNKIIKKGTVIQFKAYHYSKDKTKLTKSDALRYLEYTWLLKGGWINSGDSILGYYIDSGDTRFWQNSIGVGNHKRGSHLITKPEILEIS